MSSKKCWICDEPGSAVPSKTLIGTYKDVCAEGTGCSALYARRHEATKAKWRKLFGRI